MKTYKVLCKCKHEFQEKTYGKSTRLANPTSKTYPDGMIDVRCTVCGAIHKVKSS